MCHMIRVPSRIGGGKGRPAYIVLANPAMLAERFPQPVMFHLTRTRTQANFGAGALAGARNNLRLDAQLSTLRLAKYVQGRRSVRSE